MNGHINVYEAETGDPAEREFIVYAPLSGADQVLRHYSMPHLRDRKGNLELFLLRVEAPPRSGYWKVLASYRPLPPPDYQI